MKIVSFSSPLSASNYIAGAGTVTGIQLRSVDFDAAIARFSLVNADDSVRPEVNGVAISEPPNATDESIAADVRSAIAATL